MTTQAKTKMIPQSDLIKMEFDPLYNRDAVTLQNKSYGSTAGSALTVAVPFGQPVRAGNDSGKTVFALATEETSVTGIYVDQRAITSLGYSSSLTYSPLCLVRGPAIVLSSGLAVNDVAGGTFTQATLRTRLATLGIIVRPSPTYQTDAATDPNA